MNEIIHPAGTTAIVPKASAEDFLGRFREIVSDPLNLLIYRVPEAGLVQNELVCLHNGIWVPITGNGAYFGKFSEILAINRGVHEPLEEYVFQTVISHLPEAPIMLELGAYWGHYSMWLKKRRPAAKTILVEADKNHLEVGVENFTRNSIEGEFIHMFVGAEGFEIDAFSEERPGLPLNIVHADIDLNELEMLRGASKSLAEHKIERLFVSTHSQTLHAQVIKRLQYLGYKIEVTSDFDNETTSFDGFVFATAPHIKPTFKNNLGLLFGRADNLNLTPEKVMIKLGAIAQYKHQDTSN